MIKHQALPNIEGIIGEPIKPLNLNYYFQSDDNRIVFDAKLLDGSPLPQDVVCSPDGIIRGTPAPGADIIQHYRVIITAKNVSGETVNSLLSLEITQKQQQHENEMGYRSISLQPERSLTQTHEKETKQKHPHKKVSFADTIKEALEHMEPKEK